jgi:hypothetical protein
MCHAISEVQEDRQTSTFKTSYFRTTFFQRWENLSTDCLYAIIEILLSHARNSSQARSLSIMISAPTAEGTRMSSLYASDKSSTTRLSSETITSTTKVPSGPPVLSILKAKFVADETEVMEKRIHPGYDQRQAPESTSPPSIAGDSRPTLKTGRRLPIPTLIAFVALCLCIFLVALDTVLIPTALPTIALSFHIRDSLYAWIGSAYLLANAASVPFWGKLSDIFGRKPVIIAANFIFMFGSIVCAVSTNVSMLIAGRVVQGFGGGGVVVLVHVCVSDLFSIR